ncbi:hypothetical protein D3C75_1144840 [compost metagenome]
MCGLPEDMRIEIMELAKSYPYHIEIVKEYYLMGGKEHAELLLQGRMGLIASAPSIDSETIDRAIKMLSYNIWGNKNKSLKELLGGKPQ